MKQVVIQKVYLSTYDTYNDFLKKNINTRKEAATQLFYGPLGFLAIELWKAILDFQVTEILSKQGVTFYTESKFFLSNTGVTFTCSMKYAVTL